MRLVSPRTLAAPPAECTLIPGQCLYPLTHSSHPSSSRKPSLMTGHIRGLLWGLTVPSSTLPDLTSR